MTRSDGRVVDQLRTKECPTGVFTAAGEVRYAHYVWNVPFSDGDCHANIPQMQDRGGNTVAHEGSDAG